MKVQQNGTGAVSQVYGSQPEDGSYNPEAAAMAARAMQAFIEMMLMQMSSGSAPDAGMNMSGGSGMGSGAANDLMGMLQSLDTNHDGQITFADFMPAATPQGPSGKQGPQAPAPTTSTAAPADSGGDQSGFPGAASGSGNSAGPGVSDRQNLTTAAPGTAQVVLPSSPSRLDSSSSGASEGVPATSGGPGKPPGSSLRVQGSQFGEAHHYRLVNGAEEFKVSTSDRQPGFWNMPRSEGAFLKDKFRNSDPHTFSADYVVKSGNDFSIAQLFHNGAPGGDSNPQVMVKYKDGFIISGKNRISVPEGEKFNLEIRSDKNGTTVLVDHKILSTQPFRFNDQGENYFRYGAYLQGRNNENPPQTTAVVQVMGANVSS